MATYERPGLAGVARLLGHERDRHLAALADDSYGDKRSLARVHADVPCVRSQT